jgi:hypothetical protein
MDDGKAKEIEAIADIHQELPPTSNPYYETAFREESFGSNTALNTSHGRYNRTVVG